MLMMEWREQSAVSYEDAFSEAQRWIEAATKKTFGSNNFRSALENGVLLCDLVNRIKPGIIKRVNRLSTPIAGLDNLNVFLKACGKLGLKEAQLFHPGDLQDLSSRVTIKRQETSRRLKNVLITLYWLGRTAQNDPLYHGPYLNLKAFEGLLGIALSKALEDSLVSQRGGRSSVRDSGFGDGWYCEREDLFYLRGGRQPRRENSLDSLDSESSRPPSISSDTTLKGSSEGCYSDAEGDSIFKMADNKDPLHYRRSLVLTPKTATQFNQFLPTKDKTSGYVPAPLRKKRAERQEDNRRSWVGPQFTEEDGTFTSETRPSTDFQGNGLPQSAPPEQVYQFESGSDSDAERPDPDLVLDDLASRRFHSPSPAPPTNFAVPIGLPEGGVGVLGGRVGGGGGGTWPRVSASSGTPPRQTSTFLSSSSSALCAPQHASVRVDHGRPTSADSLLRQLWDDSEDEDDDDGYADPVQDDLYARKVGISPQPITSAPYNKFLPKFWTPEEDTHIQKIKLGSQRRPWYRKMQGFSTKKSGSSSDDSDCDVSPWLSSAPPPPAAGPSLPHPHAPQGSALPAGQSPHTHPHTAPQQTPKPILLLERPPPVFSRVDPSSGPRLVRGERRVLLGRQDPLEVPEPWEVGDAVLPDLENDDMFARRTQAFQSNSDLALMKTSVRMRRSCSPELEVNIVTQPSRPGDSRRPCLPDIQRDDVVYRKVNSQQAQRPLSGDPERYTPLQIPEPWALPPSLQARLLCPPCPLTQEVPSEDQNQDQKKEERPKTDDMLLRKFGVGALGQGSHPAKSANQMTPSVPTSCSKGDLQKMQEIREASRLRFRKRLLVERALRKPDGIDGSKSLSDIAVDTASLRQVRYEELQKFREQVKESEDKWQDDLTKWKNRRRSVNSDIVKKKEEREEVEVLTGRSRKSKTFREMQEERENRDIRSSLSSRLSSLTSLDQDVFEEPVPVPRTRTLPIRSYTIDTPCAAEDRPTSRSVAHLREDPPPASLEPNRAISPPTVEKVDTGGLPTSSSLSSILKPSSPNPPAAMEISSSPVNTEEDTSAPTPNLLMKAPESWAPWASRQAKETPSAGLLDEQPQPGSGMPPGVSRVSASLPRSYQRSDSARLTSVVTARPFGTQSTRVTSLPRAFTMDESLRRVNGEPEAARKPLTSIPVLGRYGQVMTSEDEARSSSAQSSNEEEEEEEGEQEKEEEERSGTPTASVSLVVPQIENYSSGSQTKAVSPIPVPVSPTPPKDTNQESFCDMRISLNQKPNSSRDFGFHAEWDSTGAHITSIQTGSSAEQCQLQVGDEVMAVSGHKVSDMSYSEWKSSLEDALQQGSLVLDVRRHGKNHWDRDHSSLPFKSHKIINLTSMDHPTLLGGPEKTTVNTTSLDFTSSTSNESAKEVPNHPIIDMASNGVNGSFFHKPVTLRNKESEPISLKNLKRRSEFFEQGGSESAISDLAVPSIAPSSTRWSWDPEEERRRQEKWQKEQELLLQEKYKRDQEKLEEEWRRAQQEAVNQDSTHQQEAQLSLDVNNSSISPHSPSSPLSQATPPLEGQEEAQARALEEERSWLEEQERRRQEEERRKREEEERELERLQEERKRREQQEEEEKRKREEEELRWQRKRQEEREEERRRQEEQQRKDRERYQEKQRGGDSYGYAQVQPELSMTDRVKSKSTPHLDDVDPPDSRGRYGHPGGMAQRLLEEELRRQQDRRAQGQRAASQLELERRDILNAMRYREPERVTSSGSASWGKKGDSLSQAEAERQQILREMKKKTQLLTDNSWIRQRSTSTTTSREPIDLPGPIRRGDSLDNLDGPRSSWRSSWTPGSTSSIPNYSRPHSAMSTSGGGAGAGSWARPGSSTLPSSYSMSSLRAGGGNPSSSWSQRSSSPTSPTTSPEPPAEQHQPSQQQRSRSVSGKKICTLCDSPLGKGAAMIIESLGLCYHLGCFKCIDCRCDLGGSEAGAEVRIRNKQLYCNSCYVRFKSGQPTSM